MEKTTRFVDKNINKCVPTRVKTKSTKTWTEPIPSEARVFSAVDGPSREEPEHMVFNGYSTDVLQALAGNATPAHIRTINAAFKSRHKTSNQAKALILCLNLFKRETWKEMC